MNLTEDRFSMHWDNQYDCKVLHDKDHKKEWRFAPDCSNRNQSMINYLNTLNRHLEDGDGKVNEYLAQLIGEKIIIPINQNG